MVKTSDVEIRYNAAFNIPGLVSIFYPKYESIFEFKEVLIELANDEEANIRDSIASGFYMVVEHWSSTQKDALELTEVLASLLKDPEQSIRDKLVKNLTHIVRHYFSENVKQPGSNPPSTTTSSSSNDQQMPKINLGMAAEEEKPELDPKAEFFSNLLTHLIEYNNELYQQKSLWRNYNSFVGQLQECMPYFDLKVVCREIAPRMLESLKTANFQTMVVVCEFLVKMLYHYHRMGEKFLMIDMIITDFARAKSCYHRLIFLHFAINAAETFSNKMFLEYFYDVVINYAYDQVANVRLMFCKFMYTLGFNVPLDKPRRMQISQAFDSLKTDRD